MKDYCHVVRRSWTGFQMMNPWPRAQSGGQDGDRGIATSCGGKIARSRGSWRLITCNPSLAEIRVAALREENFWLMPRFATHRPQNQDAPGCSASKTPAAVAGDWNARGRAPAIKTPMTTMDIMSSATQVRLCVVSQVFEKRLLW